MAVPQAFLDGLRTSAGNAGMGGIRNSGMRSNDQWYAGQGNPNTVYNQPNTQAQPTDSQRGWASMVPQDTRQQTLQNMATQQQQASGTPQAAYTQPTINPQWGNQPMQGSNPGQVQQGVATPAAMQNGIQPVAQQFGTTIPQLQGRPQLSVGSAQTMGVPSLQGNPGMTQQTATALPTYSPRNYGGGGPQQPFNSPNYNRVLNF